MNIWYAIPSAKSPSDWSTIAEWRARGYKVAVFRDAGAEELPDVDLQVFGEYKGYPAAVNSLTRQILLDDSAAAFIVTGGDDISPDPRFHPTEIALDCRGRFDGTLGVMQPTGDRWMVQNGLAATERVCESPWMGRDWCLRSFQGKGPYPEGYSHFFCDEHLHEVAKKLGLLWHRPDLTQYHHHWSRRGPQQKQRPDYLVPAKLQWNEGKTFFEAQKAAGFPGHELLA